MEALTMDIIGSGLVVGSVLALAVGILVAWLR